MALILISLLLLLLIVGAFRRRFQEATLYWGRTMAGLDQSAHGSGMQDELTAPLQTSLTVAYWIACVAVFVRGFFVLPWYIALLWPIPFSVLKHLLVSWLPAPSSDYYRQRIITSLSSRRDRFLRTGNPKAEMASSYIAQLKRDASR
jgi:fatty acid desaturase